MLTFCFLGLTVLEAPARAGFRPPSSAFALLAADLAFFLADSFDFRSILLFFSTTLRIFSSSPSIAWLNCFEEVICITIEKFVDGLESDGFTMCG